MVQMFMLPMSPRDQMMQQLGLSVGQGVAKNFAPPEQMVQRNLLKNAFAEAKAAMKQPGTSQLDKIMSFMEAGAGIPGSEKYMGAVLPLVTQLAQAEASQNAPFGIGGAQPGPGMQPMQGQPGQQPAMTKTEQGLQNFLQPPQPENQFYPSNVGAQQAPGNLPQAATGGIKQPIASNKDLLDWSKSYAKQKTDAGLPTTPAEAYQELKAINEDNKAANELIETERKERVASQREYGNIAENKLLNVMPEAGDEEKAYIKKQVEQLAGQNASEADIERLAAGEARKYKNMLSKIDNDIPATRIYNAPFQDFMGKSKTAEQARRDLKIKIQPLLDAGLYDKARSVLAKKGYYPEEREMIITNLGENSDKTVSKMPKMREPSSTPEAPTPTSYVPRDVENFKNNLNEVLQADPNTNLILLRRKYEQEKGVDWRLFKDSLNDAIEQGIFKPNGDQFNQLDKLDEPPLDRLDRLLFRLGISGR